MINFSTKPTIVGEKVILRPFTTEEDLPHLEECLEDPEVIKLTGSPLTYNREDLVNWYSTRNQQTDRLDLAIVDKSQNILVGEVVINQFDEATNGMNFRILIGPNGRNRGLGTETTQLILDYVFRNTTLHHITLGVYAFNPRAIRVYEKMGFVVESVDKNDLEFEGELIDAFNMKLSRESWLKQSNLAL
jgi:RimJ/RimL family protein N-acetyltransferase